MELFNTITVTDIVYAHIIPTAKGRQVLMKDRSSYGLSFCKDEGRIVYTMNGKKTVSDKSCAVLLPMGGTYTLRNEEGGGFPIINFHALEPITDEIISVPLSSPESYLDSFDKLSALTLLPEGRARAFSVFYSILSRLSEEGRREEDLIDGALRYLSANLTDPELSNKELAAAANISEVYFRRLFKERYGTTPKQYIISKRIELAKELLTSGGGSISAVSEKCGFSGVYHFSRCFREITGMSPSEYSGKRKP